MLGSETFHIRDHSFSGEHGHDKTLSMKSGGTFRHSLRLCRGSTVDTPVLLSTKSTGVVCLPEVVVRIEQDQVAGESRLQAGNGSSLVSLTGDSHSVGRSLAGPAGLGDHGVHTAASLADRLSAAENVWASVGGGDVGVEECVGVGGSVVGGLAESRVLGDGVPGVDGDDLASVACSAEEATSDTNGSDDFRDGSTAVVDELVTDADGVEAVPVASGVGDDLGDFRCGLGDVVNTGEELHTLSLGSGTDGVELVAVDTVQADHGVSIETGEVGVDLALRLASTVCVVGRVGEAETAS